MTFTPKDWRNAPDYSTPINAESLEDMERRLAAYTDSLIDPTFGGARLVNPIVPSTLVYRDVNKDGFYYIQNFDDQSGSNSPLTYFKGWGARGTKSGAGNFDLFWGSVIHKGSGEVGGFIFDATADATGAGGNLWGIDIVLIDNKNAQIYGGRLVLNPTVARSGKAGIGLLVQNQNDAIQLDQGIRIHGNWNRPFIAYSDAAGTAIIFDIDSAGSVRAAGDLSPLASGTKDLGLLGKNWRTLRVNNILMNGGDAAGGSGVIALHNMAVAPTTTPAAGGVIYVDAGVLKFRDGAGGTTQIAPTGILNVKAYGAKGDGVADDRAAIQAAIDTAAAFVDDQTMAGAAITIPPGTYNIGSPGLVAKRGVNIQGAGKEATILRRTANHILLDVSGTADDPATGMLLNVHIKDLELNSTSRAIGTWTNPLVRAYYSQFVHWTNVNFRRAGGRAIAAVRYYDGEFTNCRFDWCGATGYAVVHLMSSEQGLTAGQFGYSTDSCNNLYFNDCTWEQNPGRELWADGRQSDGTYNLSRRLNMCRFNGCKMENATSSERSNDSRVLLDTTSHFDLSGLTVSIRGTADGTSVTDLLVLKNCFNLAMPHYTAVMNEATPTQQAGRTGLSLIGGNVGVRIGQVCGTVQTNNRPSVALVEYTGTNDVNIDNAYYDNNPSNAALYIGAPSTVAGVDPEQAQAIIPGWSGRFLTPGTRQFSAGGTAYLTRFVPRKPTRVTAIKFLVTTAATTDDPIDVGIYASNGTTRLGSSGATTGQLNVTGWHTINLTAAVQLDPNKVYFIAAAAPASTGTAGTVYGLANAASSTAAHQANGTAPPGVEFTSVATSYPLPATLGAGNSGLASVPALYLV